jgi:hypothetical protein
MPPQHHSGPRRISTRYSLSETLKFHKPWIVVAFDADGEELAKINVPDVRNKWARVLESLEGLEWAKCQLCDKKGGHLGFHHRTSDDRDPATELETLMPSKFTAETSAMVNIMLRAQDMALQRHERALEPLLNAHTRILDQSMKRLELIEKQYEHALSLNHHLSQELVNAQLALSSGPDVADEDDGKSKSQKAAEEAAGQFIPGIIGAMLEPKPKKDAPKNGANGATPTEKRPKQPPPTGGSES